MRVVGWQVLPVIVADDGENLEAVQVQPQMIPASQWQAFKDGGDRDGLARLRAQVEGDGDGSQLSPPLSQQPGRPSPPGPR
jgi:hypothetical protein